MPKHSETPLAIGERPGASMRQPRCNRFATRSANSILAEHDENLLLAATFSWMPGLCSRMSIGLFYL